MDHTLFRRSLLVVSCCEGESNNLLSCLFRSVTGYFLRNQQRKVKISLSTFLTTKMKRYWTVDLCCLRIISVLGELTALVTDYVHKTFADEHCRVFQSYRM